jgi:hypothetical protein
MAYGKQSTVELFSQVCTAHAVYAGVPASGRESRSNCQRRLAVPSQLAVLLQWNCSALAMEVIFQTLIPLFPEQRHSLLSIWQCTRRVSDPSTTTQRHAMWSWCFVLTHPVRLLLPLACVHWPPTPWSPPERSCTGPPTNVPEFAGPWECPDTKVGSTCTASCRRGGADWTATCKGNNGWTVKAGRCELDTADG